MIVNQNIWMVNVSTFYRSQTHLLLTMIKRQCKRWTEDEYHAAGVTDLDKNDDVRKGGKGERVKHY